MIRVLLFLVLVALLALGVAWFADRPGDVMITWLGYRVETSVMVLIFAVALVAIMAVVLWSVLSALGRSPRNIAVYLRNRRTAKGHLAITRGLVAIGAGDVKAARRFADEARRLVKGEPLALLLSAQAAQLGGERAAAEQTFRQMSERDDTKLLGLHGLFVEARRRDDAASARGVAEEAAKSAPALAWAAQAVLEFRCADRDWTGALAALDSNKMSRLIDKTTHRRHRAVLLTARALSRDTGDRAAVKALAVEAVKLCPELVPAAALAGRLLAEDGEMRKASRAIEAAWRANPHPDLAEAYAHLRPGDSARDRLTRVQTLANMCVDAEGALAVARAAIDAREFAVARTALAPLLVTPTRRVALLMAQIEDADTGDVGRAREWMARALNAARDPAWTADGLVSEKWLPVSPVSGRIDAFQWRVPLADLPSPGQVINEVIDEVRPAPVVFSQRMETREPKAGGSDAAAGARRSASPSASADSIIPLVHAPDDPGPEPGSDIEPVAEASSNGWQRLRALFR